MYNIFHRTFFKERTWQQHNTTYIVHLNFHLKLSSQWGTPHYSANINDNNGLFVDYLKYNFAVSRNDETEFDGTSSAGVVTHIVESNSGTSRSLYQTSASNNYNFAGWKTGKCVFSPTDNSLYPNPAMYKLHINPTTHPLCHNSQRKLVRTRRRLASSSLWKHGHVWLEQSTDGGSTWFIGNADVSR